MNDLLLTKLFEPSRWQAAIDKGISKDMHKSDLEYLSNPNTIAEIYRRIRDHQYKITPPHTALIPKDDGTYRTVYVNAPADRVLLSIINDLLFDLTPHMIHPACKSYQRGIGCGKVVQEISRRIVSLSSLPTTVPEASASGPSPLSPTSPTVGFKSDLSKYFDSVPLPLIDKAFSSLEQYTGPSAVLDLLRDYYHSDLYFDGDQLSSKYQSLKQGCAVASWLADVILFDIDTIITSTFPGSIYYRYSDDIIFVGPDWQQAYDLLLSRLSDLGISINQKKTEYITADHWFKFLGFSIKGNLITLSKTRIKTFQHEIEKRTTHVYSPKLHKFIKPTLTQATNAVNRYLYYGDGQHSWATQVLPILNCTKDLSTLNTFVTDCLRAVSSGKGRVGGLGFENTHPDYCILRGRGRHVSTNRLKHPLPLPDYYPLQCMQKVMASSRQAYDTLVRGLGVKGSHINWTLTNAHRTLRIGDHTLILNGSTEGCTPITAAFPTTDAILQTLHALYHDYKHSRPTTRSSSNLHPYFYALPLEDLTNDDFLYSIPRDEARHNLETFLHLLITQQALPWSSLFPSLPITPHSPSQPPVSEASASDPSIPFYWQSPLDPDLILLHSWFTTPSPNPR